MYTKNDKKKIPPIVAQKIRWCFIQSVTQLHIIYYYIFNKHKTQDKTMSITLDIFLKKSSLYSKHLQFLQRSRQKKILHAFFFY